CALCHGADRAGYQADNAPSLKSPTFLASASDDFLRAAIVRGRPGTAMGGYGKVVNGPLADADVAALIKFLRVGAPPPAQIAPPPPDRTVPDDLPIVINPKGKPPTFPALTEDRYVPMAAVKQALDDGRRMVIADARPPGDWIRAHIPGSLSIPYYDPTMIDK